MEAQRARWGVENCGSGLPFAPIYLALSYLAISNFLFLRPILLLRPVGVPLLDLDGGYICLRLGCFLALCFSLFLRVCVV